MQELSDIAWFGHASFSFVDKNGMRIYYIDPFQLPQKKIEKAVSETKKIKYVE